MQDVTLLYATAPDSACAKRLAEALIEQKLAACVNILSPMESVYAWEERIETASEIPLLIKTTKATSDKARARIIELHPYDCPCVLALEVNSEQSHPPFVEWIAHYVNAHAQPK